MYTKSKRSLQWAKIRHKWNILTRISRWRVATLIQRPSNGIIYRPSHFRNHHCITWLISKRSNHRVILNKTCVVQLWCSLSLTMSDRNNASCENCDKSHHWWPFENRGVEVSVCLDPGYYTLYRCHENIAMRQAHINIHKVHSASHSNTQAQVPSPWENEHDTTGKGGTPVLFR